MAQRKPQQNNKPNKRANPTGVAKPKAINPHFHPSTDSFALYA